MLTITISPLKKLKCSTSLVKPLGTPSDTFRLSLRISYLFGLYLLIR